MTSPLTTMSPLVVGRDRIEDRQGTPLALVVWPELSPLKGWMRRASQRARATSFDLVGPGGDLLCRAVEGSLRPGKEPSRVFRPDGTEMGRVEVVRTGPRSYDFILIDALGGSLAKGRFITRTKYGEIPGKLTHAFEDAAGHRLATADRKPNGGPQRIGFDGKASQDLRLMVICLMIMLPNGEIGGPTGARPMPREPEDFAQVRPGSPPPMERGPFPGPTFVYHRDRVGFPDGRTAATVREPFVAPHRGLSRALSENPETGRHRFEVADPQGQALFIIDKSGGAIRDDAEVSLPDGGRLGSIKRTGGMAKAVYTITAEPGIALATVTATGSFSSDYAVTGPGGAQVAALSRVQAVDEPWRIGLGGDCDERLRILIVAFVIVQDLMLAL